MATNLEVFKGDETNSQRAGLPLAISYDGCVEFLRLEAVFAEEFWRGVKHVSDKCGFLEHFCTF